MKSLAFILVLIFCISSFAQEAGVQAPKIIYKYKKYLNVVFNYQTVNLILMFKRSFCINIIIKKTNYFRLYFNTQITCPMFKRSLSITIFMLILIFAFVNCGRNGKELTEEQIEWEANLKFRNIQDSLTVSLKNKSLQILKQTR